MTRMRPRHTDKSRTVGAERRDDTIRRVPFEALVEVGAGSLGGFEAESVDVSVDGIRLRTAYLPEPGESLVCRFDGLGGEVMAEGQVIWCRDEGRGGEFGVRFTGLDERGADLLYSLCSPSVAPPEAELVDPDGAMPGARVRLHIQGLGSPMRARVRDATRGEVLIGSNLEFLRVGRDVELEDVAQGKRRIAHIEHVTVEIDAEKQIPQLVVALRYEDVPLDDAPDSDETTMPFEVRRDTVSSGPPSMEFGRKETTPEPTVIDNDGSDDDHEAWGAHRASSPARPRSASWADEERARASGQWREADVEEDDDEDVDVPEVTPAGERAMRHARTLAGKVGPSLASAGQTAKGVLGKVLATVQRKRTEQKHRRDERTKARAPKRTTAPPPSGALRSDGKRMFRDRAEPRRGREEVEAVDAPEQSAVPDAKRRDRKRAISGAVIGIIAVIAIYAGATSLSKGDAEPVEASATVEVAADGTSIATADVPLFGATPFSTTEPVPAPPELDDDPGASPGDQGKVDSGASLDLRKEWGVGSVDNATILRIKMDGTIEGFEGAEGATGFTLVVPSRKSISSTYGLARKDKRIESVNVVNYPDRAEVTVHFKKDVPAFLVRAQGKGLLIELNGTEKAKKKKSSKKKSEKKSSKKKSEKKSSKKKSEKKSSKKKSEKKSSKKKK